MNAKPISVNKNNGCGTSALLLFGCFFFLFAAFVLWLAFVQPLLNWNAARSWPTAQGKILSAKVEVHHGDDGSTYSAEFTYEYSVKGNRYQNNRYNFFSVSGRRKRAKALVDEHPVGSTTEIFYDPQDPQNSVMSLALGWWLAIALVPLLFMAIGATVVFGVLKYGWGKSDPKKESQSISSSSPADSMVAPAKESPTFELLDANFDGPLKLKPENSRTLVFVGVLLACLSWNGILSFFVRQVIEDGFPWFDTLFMTPFLLVGMGLVIGVVYTFLALFNPIVEIALSQGAITLGQEVDFAWEVKGQATRFQKLTIKVVGEEVATYQQGTDTRTATETFQQIGIVETDNKEEFAFGTTVLRIPVDTMHSFKSDHNEIKWTVVVHGDIPYWPDVNQSMVFRVKP